MMENGRPACPFCESTDIRTKRTTILSGRIFICNSCEIGFDRAPRTVDYVTDSVFTIVGDKIEQYRRYAGRIVNMIKQAAERKKLILPSGKIDVLEIGSGYGLTSDGIARELPVAKYYHFELNLGMQRWLKSNNKSVLSSLDDIDKVDIIIMSHVLEHIKNAKEYVTRLLDAKLRTNGYLILFQTDHSGFIPSFLPFLWYGWQLQEHYYHFTPKTLSRWCESSKEYNVVSVVKYDLDQDFSLSVKGFVKLFLKAVNYVIPENRYDAFMLCIRKNTTRPGSA